MLTLTIVFVLYLLIAFIFVYRGRFEYIQYINSLIFQFEIHNQIIISEMDKEHTIKRFITKSIFCVVYTWVTGYFVAVTHTVTYYLRVDFGNVIFENLQEEFYVGGKNQTPTTKER
jgi:hypothetical protein